MRGKYDDQNDNMLFCVDFLFTSLTIGPEVVVLCSASKFLSLRVSASK